MEPHSKSPYAPLVRRRVTFLGKVIVNARPWAGGLISGALNIVALLALLGIVAAVQPPPWVVSASLGAVLLVSLGEGAYRTWDETDGQLAKARGELERESSADAVIVRLHGYAREFELLREEIPDPEAPPTSPQTAKPIDVWIGDVNDLNQRVARDVRLHASEMLRYWRTNPQGFDPLPPTVEKCEFFIDYSLDQLREIESHVREQG